MKFLNEIDGADKVKQDSNNRFVTDVEKASWNAKQDALGYTPVNKAGDTMTGDLKVAGDVVAANKLAVGFNNVDSERFRFEYNGSTGRLELWANSSDSGTWVKKVEFPKRQDDNDFSLLLGGNQVWHEGNFDPSTKSNVNHNHSLANLSEKSYNSLTDKPNIPSKVSELENDAGYVTQEELGDAGYGDMLKSIYDQNNNGIVDNAEKLGGKLPSYYEQVYHTGANPPTNTNLLWVDTGA